MDTPFVLVVDDDRNIVMMLEAWLSEAGYRVESATNGAQAYEKAVAPECRCVLLDMEMPDFNGAKFLLLLHSEDIDVPVVIITGFTDFEEDELKQFANVSAFFEKPMSRNDIIATVNALVAP
jgi:DNA-binding NtrC family response regulator